MEKHEVIVIGAGGHAKSVVDIMLQEGVYQVAGCIDPCYDPRTPAWLMDGIPIIGRDEMLPAFYRKGISHIFVALGENRLRDRLYGYALAIGYQPVNAISPHAAISPRACLGQGVCVMPGAVVNVNATIGDNCIINTNCSIDHDCRIKKSAHIAPGAAISGCVTVGALSQVGTGASVIDGVSIGDNAMVGAGAVVVSDIPDNVLAYGVPAKKIKDLTR